MSAEVKNFYQQYFECIACAPLSSTHELRITATLEREAKVRLCDLLVRCSHALLNAPRYSHLCLSYGRTRLRATANGPSGLCLSSSPRKRSCWPSSCMHAE